MSNIKLFRLSSDIATELQGCEFDPERHLHMLNKQSAVRSMYNCKSKKKTYA